MTPWEAYLEEHRNRFVEELIEFLKIPSISSLPQHADDVQRAARWVADRMKRAGIEGVQVLATGDTRLLRGMVAGTGQIHHLDLRTFRCAASRSA
jgi:acetylornithine deacetylase/succinyl-diaminopimelate desuccinylase-like protein